MKIKDIKDEKIGALAYLRCIENNSEADINSEVNDFYWYGTPEGYDFWEKVNEGLDPYAKDEVTEPVKNFKDLSKYPVGTRVKNGFGIVGTITHIIDDSSPYSVAIKFGAVAGGSPKLYPKDGNCAMTEKSVFNIAEVVVDKIDLNDCNDGDRLLCRNGSVLTYIGTNEPYSLDYLVLDEDVTYEVTKRNRYGKYSGDYDYPWDLDIIQVLPK